ncbi:MAG: hypothetical protein ACRD8W_12245 [Nitrososphaeraceae archaeon]
MAGAPECWVDGYDAGFAGKYDRDTANECNDIPGDQYNRSWEWGCKNARYTEQECNDLKEGDDSTDQLDLKQANIDACWWLRITTYCSKW